MPWIAAACSCHGGWLSRLITGARAEADDAERDQTPAAANMSDRAPVAALADPDRRDRLAALAAAGRTAAARAGRRGRLAGPGGPSWSRSPSRRPSWRRGRLGGRRRPSPARPRRWPPVAADFAPSPLRVPSRLRSRRAFAPAVRRRRRPRVVARSPAFLTGSTPPTGVVDVRLRLVRPRPWRTASFGEGGGRRRCSCSWGLVTVGMSGMARGWAGSRVSRPG